MDSEFLSKMLARALIARTDIAYVHAVWSYVSGNHIEAYEGGVVLLLCDGTYRYVEGSTCPHGWTCCGFAYEKTLPEAPSDLSSEELIIYSMYLYPSDRTWIVDPAPENQWVRGLIDEFGL